MATLKKRQGWKDLPADSTASIPILTAVMVDRAYIMALVTLQPNIRLVMWDNVINEHRPEAENAISGLAPI